MILGQRQDSFTSQHGAEILLENDRMAISKREPYHTEEKLTFTDGHIEVVDSVRTPLFDSNDNLIGLLGVSRDVSQRVVIENELRSTQLELKNAVDTANKANKSKSEFLARMSHEIRTPMNAIISMASIVKRKLEEQVTGSAEIMTHMRQIEISSQHLLGLLNDILDISKIEAGKIDLSEHVFNLKELVDNVSSIINPRCTEKNISFDIAIKNLEHAEFLCDSLRLRQVLINLLGNAVKFTPECGQITFTVEQLDQKNKAALISFTINDTGIGITPQAWETLFQPFAQGGGQITRQYGGTGLGLSISKNIVNLLGSDITVTSEVGIGSTFQFSIWLKEACPDTREIMPPSNANILRGKKILLVDDVDINRLIVVEQLSGTGLELDEAEDGSAAVELFKLSSPGEYDIVLMDIQMPHMDGYEATTMIRQLQRPDALSVPIIALTANAFKEDVDKAIAYGFTAHLSKPLEIHKLINLLLKYITSSSTKP